MLKIINPCAGDVIVPCVVLGIKIPLIEELISSIADESGSAPVEFIAIPPSTEGVLVPVVADV